MLPARTRVAPSPTGDPHVGTAYQSLFSYALARQTGGQFILRMEDTDQVRYDPHSEQRIFDALRWAGLRYDEGPDVGGPHAPYRQSERLPIYKAHAEMLVAAGHAYYCFCTPERLAAMRKEQEARKEPPRYDRHCLALPPAEVQTRLAAGERHVVRMHMPDTGVTTFTDLVRGEISFENRLIDDQVLMKSDGFPTYHLAVVVDDHLMQVTHIMRGEEWISSTPKHILLYQFFGWDLPVYAHTPLLLNDDRSKISKRKSPDKTRLEGFRERGFLPEALLNFLALLGWSHPDGQEIFSLAEFVRVFSPERVLKSGSVFDMNKLIWMNGHYIRTLAVDELAERLQPYTRYTPAQVREVLPVLQDRLKLLGEFDDLAAFFFAAPQYDRALFSSKQFDSAALSTHLAAARAWHAALPWPWDKEAWEAGIRQLAEERSFKKAGDLFMLLRVAVTGRKESPPLYDTMILLGREQTLARLDAAHAALASDR
ncbi:MAG TPA: glutamate--tRNA ligase [Chloroflexia bacterium]|nr:glutamate--tRNA ligase [Chloroflexia bacterium]